jgi:hypothetical protein
MVERLLASVLLLPIALACQASDTNQPSGAVAGHLKIISLETVAPADGKVPTVTSETYQKYPLVVLRQDGQQVSAVTADGQGNYRATLPAGSYVLDIQDRVRKHVRAKPVPFNVTANQTTHVNIEMDTGIR